MELGEWDFYSKINPIHSVDQHPDFAQRCSANYSNLINSNYEILDIEKLTAAIIAAEKYNRNYYQRKLEILLAQVSLKYKNTIPNFSYGLAQIKPDKIRKLLENELNNYSVDDFILLDTLRDNCQNVRLAGQYIQKLSNKFISRENNSVEKLIELVALEYNGADKENINGMRYIDAVKGAYNLLLESSYY